MPVRIVGWIGVLYGVIRGVSALSHAGDAIAHGRDLQTATQEVWLLGWAALVLLASIALLRRRQWGWAVLMTLSLWVLLGVVASGAGLVALAPAQRKGDLADIPLGAMVAYAAAPVVYRLFLLVPVITAAALLAFRQVRSWLGLDRKAEYHWAAVGALLVVGAVWSALAGAGGRIPAELAAPTSPWMTAAGVVGCLGMWSAALVIVRRRPLGIAIGAGTYIVAAVVLATALASNHQLLLRRLTYYALTPGGGARGLDVARVTERFSAHASAVLLILMLASLAALLRWRVCILAPAEFTEVKESDADTEPRPSLGERLCAHSWRELFAGLRLDWMDEPALDVLVLFLGALGVGLRATEAIAFGALGRSLFPLGWGFGALTQVALVGLIVLLVLLGIRRRRGAWPRWIATMVIAASLLLSWRYVGFPFARWCDFGLRIKIASTVGLDELESWGLRLLETEGKRLGKDAPFSEIYVHGRGKVHLVSKAIRDLRPSYIWIRDVGAGRQWVLVEFGGGFYHWGVYVGPRDTDVPPDFQGGTSYLWRPGIYGYQEGGSD
jgi:hypothetical protein